MNSFVGYLKCSYNSYCKRVYFLLECFFLNFTVILTKRASLRVVVVKVTVKDEPTCRIAKMSQSDYDCFKKS